MRQVGPCEQGVTPIVTGTHKEDDVGAHQSATTFSNLSHAFDGYCPSSTLHERAIGDSRHQSVPRPHEQPRPGIARASLHRDGLRKISRLIDIVTLDRCQFTREHLQGHRRDEGLHQGGSFRNPNNVISYPRDGFVTLFGDRDDRRSSGPNFLDVGGRSCRATPPAPGVKAPPRSHRNSFLRSMQ